mmetsp:Transcript_64915/g.153430  ORF Transcript_64915/g.153430 Transcript_64915/m.153430 type:complete len:114 (+) Transcript_64915:58-399(+)
MSQGFLHRLLRPLAEIQRSAVTKSCSLYGLRFHDILNEDDPDVKAALLRLTPQELSDRNKRLKRALDITLKRTYLHPDLQAEAAKVVWEPYLELHQVARERLEKESYQYDPTK